MKSKNRLRERKSITKTNKMKQRFIIKKQYWRPSQEYTYLFKEAFDVQLQNSLNS